MLCRELKVFVTPSNFSRGLLSHIIVELLRLGEKQQALDALYNMASRRHKVWEKPVETVVLRFLDIAVEMGRGKKAKEVLYQYRFVAQAQPQSLEVVLRHFIKASEEAVVYAHPCYSAVFSWK